MPTGIKSMIIYSEAWFFALVEPLGLVKSVEKISIIGVPAASTIIPCHQNAMSQL